MVARVSRDGIDQSGPFAKLVDRGNMGSRFYDETNRRAIYWDDELKFWLPGSHDDPIWSTASPRYVADDFKQATIFAGWSLNKGSDPQAVNFARVAPAVGGANGTIIATTGDAGTGIAADGVAIAGPLNFQFGTAPLSGAGRTTLRVRLKLSAITSVYFFVGFTDVLPATTLEEPISLSVTTFTTTATDAVGFLFDTAATTDTIRLHGVTADVDNASPIDTAIAPVADTYLELMLKANTAGAVQGFIDGVSVGTLSGLGTAVNLCPVVVACARTTATRQPTIDYILAK